MKIRTAYLLVIAVAISMSFVASAYAETYPTVVVTGYTIKNGDASVGHDFTLSLSLANTEPTVCAQSVTTTVQASAPFILRTVATEDTSALCYGDVKTVEFPVHVDPTATGGFYQITVGNTYETKLLAQYSNSNIVNIFVNGSPYLSANVVGSTPLDVYAGDTASVTIGVENDGSFAAQAVTGTLTVDAPLEAKWSGSFASFGTLAAKGSKAAQFSIEVPKTAAARDYAMVMHLTYLDENLVNQEKNVALTFHVKEKASFVTVNDGSDLLSANENARTVRFQLKNTGTDTAYKVKVKLEPQFPFSTDGSVRYITELAPGQSAPVTFVVGVDKDATIGAYGLDAILDYEDAQGKQLQDTTNVAFTVEKKGLLQAVFLDYWFFWLIVLVIVVIVIRKRSKAKKK